MVRRARAPRFQLHFTPTHSSWTNQVERRFAELERRCLERGVFCSPDDLKAALEEWIKVWNDEARPSHGPRPPTRSAATAHASPNQIISSFPFGQQESSHPC
ncbi:transposase [Streptomyces sp. NBC_00841]|nr:transposase [Streptomyces sp. NBC_00841]